MAQKVGWSTPAPEIEVRARRLHISRRVIVRFIVMTLTKRPLGGGGALDTDADAALRADLYTFQLSRPDFDLVAMQH
mgnify:CR=1 FL=1